MVQLRPRCAAHGGERDRGAEPRAHRVVVRRRPRSAIHNRRRATDALWLASGDDTQHRGDPGEDGGERRLSRRRPQRRQRRADLVGDNRVRHAAAQLAAAVQRAAHGTGAYLCARFRRKAVGAQRRRRGQQHADGAGVLWGRGVQRQCCRVRRQRVHQHAAHRRREWQRVLRFPGNGGKPGGPGQRHRARRARWYRHLGRRRRGGG